jgi:hypothetical protein
VKRLPAVVEAPVYAGGGFEMVFEDMYVGPPCAVARTFDMMASLRSSSTTIVAGV